MATRSGSSALLSSMVASRRSCLNSPEPTCTSDICTILMRQLLLARPNGQPGGYSAAASSPHVPQGSVRPERKPVHLTPQKQGEPRQFLTRSYYNTLSVRVRAGGERRGEEQYATVAPDASCPAGSGSHRRGRRDRRVEPAWRYGGRLGRRRRQAILGHSAGRDHPW